jgi:hypothetical protein
MSMVDDATGTTLSRLGDQETIWAAVQVLETWIAQYGVPMALYTDWKNVYKREATEKEWLRGEVPVTQFGRMCERLGIRILAASSAQAKGRVERNHGTHQDRLIKKMRRQKIRTHEQANQFLQQEYLAEHNRRFARMPAAAEDYHRQAPSPRQLRDVFRLETERTISNDWVVRYENRFFQLERKSQHYAPAQGKVTVCEWQDGSLAIEYRGQKLNWKAISEPAKEPNPPVKTESTRGRPRPNPAPDHPWRQQYQKMRVASPGSAPDVFRMADLRFALNARPTASQGFAPAAIRNTKSNQKRGHF